MAAEPLVSAIIPTYNNATLVADAVESVLAQTWPRVECIVVDDGSTDDTAGRLARFGERITVIRQAHAGPPVARNAGIKAARGEFIGFLDSDDIWMPEKVAHSLQPLLAKPEAGVSYTAVRIREMEDGVEYLLPQYTMSGWMARELFLECKGVNTSTLLVRRGTLEKAGLFDEQLFRAQDWDLMIRLAETAPYVHVPEVLTLRRLHSRSLSVTHRQLYAEYNLLVLRKALARRPDLYKELEKDSMSRAHFRFGMLHYGAFQMAAARAEFRRALGWQWNGAAFNYWLRSWLPARLVRRLRAWRVAREERRRAGAA